MRNEKCFSPVHWGHGDRALSSCFCHWFLKCREVKTNLINTHTHTHYNPEYIQLVCTLTDLESLFLLLHENHHRPPFFGIFSFMMFSTEAWRQACTYNSKLTEEKTQNKANSKTKDEQEAQTNCNPKCNVKHKEQHNSNHNDFQLTLMACKHRAKELNKVNPERKRFPNKTHHWDRQEPDTPTMVGNYDERQTMTNTQSKARKRHTGWDGPEPNRPGRQYEKRPKTENT